MTEERYAQRAFVPPPGSTEIVLVRHGASADAVPGDPFPLTDGHGDPPLSPLGRTQADAVAARLAREPLAALFVTGLLRTVETAAPLAALLGVEPQVIPDLREVRLGEWEGGEFRIRVQNGDPVAMQAIADERWDTIPGAESMGGLSARVRAGIGKIVERVGPDASAAAFVHGGVIGELCRQATASRPFAFIHSDNCSISRLVVLPGGRWLLRSFNDVAHLNGAGRGAAR
jgi:2,3-bisphosphoglycerate-dependent phosphoglycerate mutase